MLVSKTIKVLEDSINNTIKNHDVSNIFFEEIIFIIEEETVKPLYNTDLMIFLKEQRYLCSVNLNLKSDKSGSKDKKLKKENYFKMVYCEFKKYSDFVNDLFFIQEIKRTVFNMYCLKFTQSTVKFTRSTDEFLNNRFNYLQNYLILLSKEFTFNLNGIMNTSFSYYNNRYKVIYYNLKFYFEMIFKYKKEIEMTIFRSEDCKDFKKKLETLKNYISEDKGIVIEV
ncbi:hypothetical protein HERIO_1526 [Hepatospora eriocheir]|uniref:Uncharacterized protein n=1 Tax=Hepatospora eriocheir TaxID=1081669 RepID=A0A1X0Q9W8_9MICR|nr:hypothetical protein HERIO_1526 [Hepatospora eriocheir]